MEYKVVHFKPSDDVPGKLQSIIDVHSANGYKYINHEYSDKLSSGKDGCMGIEAEPTTKVHIGFVVFGKEE